MSAYVIEYSACSGKMTFETLFESWAAGFVDWGTHQCTRTASHLHRTCNTLQHNAFENWAAGFVDFTCVALRSFRAADRAKLLECVALCCRASALMGAKDSSTVIVELVAMCCSMLQYVVVRLLECVAVCCRASALMGAKVSSTVIVELVATCCSMLQYVAVRLLQCIAVCCSASALMGARVSYYGHFVL